MVSSSLVQLTKEDCLMEGTKCLRISCAFTLINSFDLDLLRMNFIAYLHVLMLRHTC